ncbi:MAG: M24 family metallopeptidase [Candidatus Hodarchaeales archaeon]|jgi:Xaa-Pro dipeptidase
MNPKLTRVKKLQHKMRETNIDIVIVPLGINFKWMYDTKEEPSERLLVSVIESEDSPKFLVPAFESDRIKKITGVPNVTGWEETENPFKILTKDIIPESAKTIAIEPKLWFSVFQSISQRLTGKEFVNGEELFSSLRMVKDSDEIKNLQQARKKSSDVIIQTLYDLEVGITESEVQTMLKNRLLWGANESSFNLVQFGDNSALPHYHGGDRKLMKNDVVLIDAGGTVNNYWGDITITSVFGGASGKFKEIFEIVNQANIHGKDLASQGQTPHAIDVGTRNIISKEGYGKFFTHRTGHGLGLEVHEHPYIVETNKTNLKTGNCFTIEPGIYLPGKFGIRIEDNVIKLEEGISATDIPRMKLLEV